MTGLKCRECGRLYPKAVVFVCEYCFGGVEVEYDYDAIRRVMTKESFAARPRSLWRYRELLPIEGEPTAGFFSGYTPLYRAERLGAALGVDELYLKGQVSQERLMELLGHTPVEVFVGAALGTGVALLYYR